jgi:ferritin
MALQKPNRNMGICTSRLSPKILDELNKQIEIEVESSQIYYAMHIWCENNGYLGASKLFNTYSTEERNHMQKVYNYILDRDSIPVTPVISSPQQEFIDLLDILNKGYMHEKYVTDSYNNLAQMCLENKDHVTYSFLQWFLNEQIEEEAKFKNMIDQINIMGNAKADLYLFDRDLLNT